MTRPTTAIALTAAAVFGILAAPAETPAQQTVEIREWEVPWAETRPRDPYVAPDGRIWFVGQRADYAAVLDPGTGEFERFDLPEGAGPHNLIVDDEGVVWYAGNRDHHIGRLDPRTGEITRFEVTDPGAPDPHTLLFGDDGEIWFTVQRGNRIGHFDARSGAFRVAEVPTPNARPYGIVRTGNGDIWVAAFGTNKLVRVSPAGLELQEVELPRAEARPRRLAATSDGRIWYGDYAEGRIGVYDPARGDFREWDLPGGAGARPYAVTVDDSDRVWLVETGPRGQPNRLVGFDTRAGRFLAETQIPSGAGTVRHMVYHSPTRAIWFGTDANTIGRAILP